MANIEFSYRITEIEEKACLGNGALGEEHFDLSKDIPWDKLADTVFEITKQPNDKEISLSFCDEAEIQKLNNQYRNKDYVTDVLSFPPHMPEGVDLPILGDIVICLKKAQAQAAGLNHTVKRELAFLFVHGLLHLLGYDHEESDEAELMFSLQDQVLGRFDL